LSGRPDLNVAEGSLVCGQGLLVAMEVVKAFSLASPILSVIGGELDGSLECDQGLLVPLGVVEGRAHIRPRANVVGTKLNGTPRPRQCIFTTAQSGQCCCFVVPDAAIFGGDMEGSLKGGQGLRSGPR
jgi:hypothetical protein